MSLLAIDEAKAIIHPKKTKIDNSKKLVSA